MPVISRLSSLALSLVFLVAAASASAQGLAPTAAVEAVDAIVTPIKVTLVGGKYSFDGVSTPVLKVKRGDVLVFDLSDASASKSF